MFRSEVKQTRRFWLVISICINMGLLFYFKYSNFFVENVNALISQMGFHEISWTKLVLPIGISFFTFETLTYSIDAYRKVITPLKRLPDYYLYIFLFPKLIAGPIVRFSLIEDQMHRRTVSGEDFIGGFLRFAIGLGKKVLIANTLGRHADQIFALSAGELDSSLAWTGILAYTFQIYFDFSGYSDMALGIGRMVGFRFPENFNNPYTSGSITEFWRRWHMTLGMWMREYLYIPLGGNKVKTKTRLYFNLWLVFLLSGLWHGASWNFVAWGAFHGFFLILDRIFLLKFLEKIWKPLAVLITFFLVMTGWVLFRIEDFHQIRTFFTALFRLDFNMHDRFYEIELWTTLLIAAIFSFFTLTVSGTKIQDNFYFKNTGLLRKIPGALFSIIILILCISYITTSGFNPFIYFRF